MKIQVLNVNGAKVHELVLNDQIWGIEPHEQSLYDTVIAHQATLRQGTKKTKTRAEVSGGGRKPWRQKGTGRARQGSIRAPQWRGGGIVFGPTPEINYKKAVNKKVRALALKSALSLKVKEDNLKVVDKFAFTNPSTKAMKKVISNLELGNEKTLIVLKDDDQMVTRSANNLSKIKTVRFNQVNVYDLLNAKKLLITEDAVHALEGVYA